MWFGFIWKIKSITSVQVDIIQFTSVQLHWIHPQPQAWYFKSTSSKLDPHIYQINIKESVMWNLAMFRCYTECSRHHNIILHISSLTLLHSYSLLPARRDNNCRFSLLCRAGWWRSGKQEKPCDEGHYYWLTLVISNIHNHIVIMGYINTSNKLVKNVLWSVI